jgi:hypothetical protein
MVRLTSFALVVLCADAKKKLPKERASLLSVPMMSYRNDCWKRRPVASAFLQYKNPGAGMNPDDIEPFVTVEKDGFMETDCVKDAMFTAGDKFGDNKFDYKMGDISNVSIVHYENHVAKEDREPMTHSVCFEFCRTVPEMLFFGLNMGRDCYCTPYFKPVAGDSSNCDAVCEGDPTLMCGGDLKSSVFSMHSCDDTEKVLEDTTEECKTVIEALDDVVSTLKKSAEQGEADANTMQDSFGSAGDPDASNLMQEAKIYAGELIHAAEDGEELSDEVKPAMDETKGLKGKNMKKVENVKKAEAATKAMQEGMAEATLKTEELQKLLDECAPEADEERVADSAKQYVPIMYFVDKDHQDDPSTCSGNVVQTLFGKSKDECATACDGLVGSCVGFNYFGEGDGICFLFDKFKTAQHYTGCSGEEDFLQVKGAKKTKRSAPFVAECVAKLADFEGTTLKPDKSGKCDMCLKEVTKAARCFE